MKQSTKRLVSSVVALLFLAGAFAMFTSFIQPAYRDIKSERGEALSRQLLVEEQERVITQVKNLLGTYEGEGEVQQAVSAAMPLSPAVGEALVQLNGLLAMNSLTPQSFSVAIPVLQNAEGGARAPKSAAPELIKPVGTLTFQVRFIGSYENFKSFLKELETNVRVFDVKNVNLQPSGRPTQNSYAYDLTVAAYYQSQ